MPGHFFGLCHFYDQKITMHTMKTVHSIYRLTSLGQPIGTPAVDFALFLFNQARTFWAEKNPDLDRLKVSLVA